MKQKLFLLSCFLICLSAFAQDNTGSEETMATLMRSNGKIYVVVAVLLTILVGLILYLVSIDRKISKLENED